MKQGRASTVTDLGDGTVLRRGGDPAREASLMGLAHSHGFPVPHVRGVLPDGLLLERTEGPTMVDVIRRRPWLAGRQVAILADLHERLHRIPLGGAALLHLDLHPENVIVSPTGPVVIDWTNARPGKPDQDVALTWLIMHTSAGLPGRLLAALFARRVGRSVLQSGLAAAGEFRIADPHVSDVERARVRAVLAGR